MNHVPTAKEQEIDANLHCFLQVLPDLLADHQGQYVLIRRGEIVGFFPDAIDAQIEGNQMFLDGLFSIQKVSRTEEELGHFSYALPHG